MNKAQEQVIARTGLSERFFATQTACCAACADTARPCQVNRNTAPATWWMHQATALRLELAMRITETP